MTAKCAYCAYYAALEAAEDAHPELDAAELARLDAIGQRWARIGRAVLAGHLPAVTP